MSAATSPGLAREPVGARRVQVSEATIDPVALDRIASVLEAHTGLAFPPTRHHLLARAVASCAGEYGLDPWRDVDRLTEPGSPVWRRLVAHARVGETYFFRHAEQLEAFRHLVLAPLVRARQTEARPRVRLWSAGCATGEEAYSLAMLVVESLPDSARWDVRVVGTDIDPAALERARAGTYGRWSFRVDGPYRDRWFEHVSGGERVRDALRERVAFEEHNLANPAALLPLSLDGPVDAVVCRNVTIYMGPAAVRTVVDRLYDALAPGGWLLVGPVEPSPEVYARFVAYQRDGFTIYQRPVTKAAEGPVAARVASPPTDNGVVRPAHARPASLGRLLVAGSPGRVGAVPVMRPVSEALLREARVLADRGDLGEAERRCRRALGLDPRVTGGYALLAAIADGRDDLDGACHALGRAIYLRREDPVPYFQLGLLEWRRGRTPQAHARLRTALRLLDGRPDEDRLDGASGLTVGRVRSVIAGMEM